MNLNSNQQHSGSFAGSARVRHGEYCAADCPWGAAGARYPVSTTAARGLRYIFARASVFASISWPLVCLEKYTRDGVIDAASAGAIIVRSVGGTGAGHFMILFC